MLAKKIRLYQDVDFLSSIYPYRNYKNIGSLRKAADYIEKEFEKTGFTISRQEWEARGNIYQNIIASYQPEAKQRFIVGAHYDVYKDQPGADDNASAVAGLLEIARLLSEHQYNLPYGIDFVAFCLEEPPFFRTKKMGSYIHAKSLHEHDQEVIGMIALEMIGYFGEKTKKNRIRKRPAYPYLLTTITSSYPGSVGSNPSMTRSKDCFVSMDFSMFVPSHMSMTILIMPLLIIATIGSLISRR